MFGEVLGATSAVAGIGIVGMGAGMLANQTAQIVPRAKKTLAREKG
jgi:hypothetical protein